MAVSMSKAIAVHVVAQTAYMFALIPFKCELHACAPASHVFKASSN